MSSHKWKNCFCGQSTSSGAHRAATQTGHPEPSQPTYTRMRFNSMSAIALNSSLVDVTRLPRAPQTNTSPEDPTNFTLIGKTTYNSMTSTSATNTKQSQRNLFTCIPWQSAVIENGKAYSSPGKFSENCRAHNNNSIPIIHCTIF